MPYTLDLRGENVTFQTDPEAPEQTGVVQHSNLRRTLVVLPNKSVVAAPTLLVRLTTEPVPAPGV